MNGFEVRFEYDNTKLQPSNISTNEIISDVSNINNYFKFESEFAGTSERPILMMDADINEPGKADNVIIATMELYPPLSTLPTSEHIIEKNGNKTISTGEKVKFGEMSFQMITDDPFDITGFKLKENVDYSPNTGIKVNLNAINHFSAKSTFRFTDATASKNADLSNIIVSSGEENQSNYKEYDLSPEFNIETKKYTVTLLEYIDTINITATTPEDSKSTMKIKVPKHDSDGNLIYESDGTTIKYDEEKDITDKVPFGVTLNKLGEPDTKLTISVTAEDGVTKNEYEIVIKRPYGIIKGSIHTIATTSTTNIHKSDVRIYKSDDVRNIINWDNIVSGSTDDIHDQLLTLTSENYKTNDDGTYEIYVIPGTYDILLDKPGYLDHIYTSRTVAEGSTVDLGNKNLIVGDFNKDGAIQGKDLALLMSAYATTNMDSSFEEKYDVNEDNQIQGKDLAIFFTNYYMTREID